MQRNQLKRVTGISVGKREDEFWIRLEINGTGMLFVETRGLTAHQAGILGDGYINGLQWGDSAPEEIIEMLSNDSLDMASPRVAVNVDSADRRLFRRGTTGARELAANGYWLDSAEATAPGAQR